MRAVTALAPVLLLLLGPVPVARGGDDAPPPAAAPSPEKEPTGLPWREGTCGKGRLEVLPSGLAVLHLAGTPEEMGTQHGTLLRDAVRTLVRDYLPRVLRGNRPDALVRARALERGIPERHRREMAALARAAGLEYEDVLLGSVVVELFGLNLCSGAVASGPASAEGATLVGRNLEWPDHGILGKYGLLVAARPEGRRPFVSVGFPAFTGVVTGMNGDGLFAAELVVMKGVRRDKALGGIPYPVLLRRMLEECGDADGAETLAREAPRTVAQNLLLADPAGGRVLECSVDRFVVRPSVDGLVVVTNHWDEPKSPPAGDPRYANLCESFAGLPDGKVDRETLEKSLRAAAFPFMNLQCGIFEPATLAVRVALGAPPASARPFHEVDAASLLGVDPPARRGKTGEDSPAEPAGGSTR